MLNAILRFSLRQRLIVAALSLLLLVLGGWQINRLPIDVFPNLDRPRVVVMTEAPGLAPEEVKSLITFPLESSLNGATGVQAVRTSSAVGLSVVYVEFDWGTNIFDDRQIVAERLAMVSDHLPEGVVPQLAPVSSIMGQIMIIGMWSDDDDAKSPMRLRTEADWVVRQRLLTIPGVSQVFVMGGQRKQFQVLVSPDELLRFGVTMHEVKTALRESNRNATGGYLDQQGPNELLVRSRGRIRTLEELAEVVVTIRDGRPVLLRQVARVVEGHQVKRGDAAAAVRQADGSFAGGQAVVLTVNKQPGADTRRVTDDITQALAELEQRLPAGVRIEPNLYQQKSFIDRAIENVVEALRDGSILVVVVLFLFLLNVRTTLITLTAIPLSIVITALVFAAFELSINTMTLGGLAIAMGELVDDAIVDVENIFRRLKENRHSPQPLSPLVIVYQASAEIRNSIVFGTVIVVLVFLPVFWLGGMEGRLFRPLGIAYIVSILSSLGVSLTLTPVLSYWLLGFPRYWRWVAVIVAPLLSLAVSWGIAPSALHWLGLDAWSHWLTGLPLRVHLAIAAVATPLLWLLMLSVDRLSDDERDGPLLRSLKSVAGGAIGWSVRRPLVVVAASVAVVAAAAVGMLNLESDFLPPFNEGSVQINVILPPGTSLAVSQDAAEKVQRQLEQIDDLETMVRKTGRAELDEHAVTVNMSEIIATFENSERSREEILAELRSVLEKTGVQYGVEQPLAHLMSHMVSGVKTNVAVKLYGDDLETLRSTAKKIEAAMRAVPGVVNPQVEPQVDIPQLRIDIEGQALTTYGLRREQVNDLVETAMHGTVVSQVLVGERTFDLLVRLDESYRENLDAIRRLSVTLPTGGTTSLESVAKIYEADGPNTINREQVRGRIIIGCNTAGRGLVDVVRDIKAKIKPIERDLPNGYFIEYGGQFQAQQSASRVIAVLFVVSLVGMFLVLYTMFRSANLALQVMAALPMAFIGSVAALHLTGQTLTVASMVGFISLCGIASRNGILLINHYLHLVQYEGESWTERMIVRAGQERLAPVLMTALTSGIGLVPLALAAGQPGKEILYPVATVMIGGLVTSTVLEFFLRPAMFWRFGLAAAQKASGAISDDELKSAVVDRPMRAHDKDASSRVSGA